MVVFGKYIRILTTFLLCLDIVFSMRCGKKSEDQIRYPGNGIPFLSEDKPMEVLNREIATYSVICSNCIWDGRRLYFKNVENYDFVSTKSLFGKYWIRLDLYIADGECRIQLGDAFYTITSDRCILRNSEGTVIFDAEGQTEGITFCYNGYEPPATFASVDGKGYSPEQVKLKVMASSKIAIKLSKRCTGFIGPWMWVRGME